MTTTAPRPTVSTSEPGHVSPTVGRKGNVFVGWITSTDHKTIGYMYLITSFVYFLIGGVMALLIRAQLFAPGLEVVATKEQYNQLFTMHGTIMLLMFATPLFAGFANVLMPLQIGAPDVAFPRLNAFAYWLYSFGSLIAVAGFLTPQGAASFGWFAYAPLSSQTFSPGLGGNMWVFGLTLSGFGTILGAVNFITTIITMRAPGMTMWRMPIFTEHPRDLVARPHGVSGARRGSLRPRLRPDVRLARIRCGDGRSDPLAAPILVLRAPRGIHHRSTLLRHRLRDLPLFSRKPIFGYKTLVYATIAIAALSITVWAHHMYVTGSVLLPFFSLMTMLIAVPTGVKIFNWIGTMWRGSVTFETPIVWALGFLVTFVFGGLTGVILASPPLDFAVSDSYFVVAHFHYVVFGTVVFAMFAGFYFWWPKWTGKMLNERLGHIHFWTLFIGFHATFLVQHWLGVVGMPRRYATYLVEDGFTWMNQLSTFGSFLLAASMIPFLLNVYITARRAPKVTVNDPWGYGRSLEWATSCPPPRHNFSSIPRIRSESPAFDLNHPEAGMPMGIGPAKDAPDADTYDISEDKVK